jgi:hypothetical protein
MKIVWWELPCLVSFGGPVNSGVRLLALKFKSSAKTCRWRVARGSLPIQLKASLSRRAAALRGTLNAASRKLNRSGEGGQRGRRGFNDGPPNNSFNPTALSLPLINLCWYISGCRYRRAAG